jgi:murein L,D-transpeptidase YafK
MLWLMLLLLAIPPAALAQTPPDTTPVLQGTHPSALRHQQRYPRVRAARAHRADRVAGYFAAAKVPYPPTGLFLRVIKDADLIEVWGQPRAGARYVKLVDYPVCARSGTLGPKRRRGDLQVPEGFYQVSGFNPASSFHLSFRLDYPNRSDRIRARAGNPGGDIFVHGACVTIGCLPITDEKIEELYLMVLDTHRATGQVPVHLFPTRMDQAGMARLQRLAAGKQSLLAFWRELQPAWDAFERHRLPPQVRITDDGSYRLGADGR